MLDRAPRSGFGATLLVAVTLLVVLGLLAFAQIPFSSSTLRMTVRDAGGAVAEELATSAIEEASWRIQQILSDPSHPRYSEVRQRLLRGATGIDLSADAQPVRLLEALARTKDRPLYRQLKLEHVNAWLRGEGDQRLDLDAAVTLTVDGREVYRRVVQRRRYGLLRVSPLAPFERVTLTVIDHSGVAAVRTSVVRTRGMIRGLAASAASLEALITVPRPPPPDCELPPVAIRPPLVDAGEPPPLPSSLAPALEEVLSTAERASPGFRQQLTTMPPDERGWAEWALVRTHRACVIELPGIDCARVDPRLSVAPPRAGILFDRLPVTTQPVVVTGPVPDMAAFDYEVRLRDTVVPLETRVLRDVADYNRWIASHVGRGRAVGDRPGFTAVWSQRLRAIVRDCPPLARALNPISRHIEAHARGPYGRAELVAAATTARSRFLPIAFHAHRQEQLDRFASELEGFSGHLSISGGGDFRLRLPSHAGLLVVSMRPRREDEPERTLHVEALAPRDPARHLVVLWAENLALRTTAIAAGVHVRDRLYLRQHGPAITGNLVMERLRPLTERGRDEELSGSVTFAPALIAGGVAGAGAPREFRSADETPDTTRALAIDHHALSLSPRHLERAVIRAREAE